MGRWLPFISAMLIAFYLSPVASASEFRDQVVIDIDNYLDVTMEFYDGDALEIDVRATALSYPMNVLLIKGDAEFERFRESESIDLDELKDGNISDMDDSVLVVQGFSKSNVTDFDSTISIGDHDTYHLIVMLHRDPSMDPQEVLQTRVTLVNVEARWEVKEKVITWILVPIAVAIFLAGAGLIGYYFWRWNRRSVEKDRVPGPSGGRVPPRR